MPPYYNYDSDLGRDLLRMEEISRGNHTLVGPQFSFGGLRLAPYHFYLFAPVLALGDHDYRVVLYANAALFVVGLLLVYLILRKRMGDVYSFMAITWLLTTPYIIQAARSPGNAFSYLIPLALVIVVHVIQPNLTLVRHFFLGALEGVIINFHPVNLIVIIPMYLRRGDIKKIIAAGIGIIMTFLPVLAFELKHNFVLTRSLFSKGGFSSGTVSLSSLSILNQATADLFPATIIGLFVLVAILLAIGYKKSKVYLPYILIAFINIAILGAINQGAIHYFLPALLLLQILVIFLNKNLKYCHWLILGLIILNIAFFPYRFYSSDRNLGEVEVKLNKAITADFIPRENLNVVLFNRTHLSRVGYEYRFLLNKNNYVVDDEYSYNNSKYLLAVSEVGEIDWKREKSWELEQFGEGVLLKKMVVDGYRFYLFARP